ncbi:MAG: transglutaminase-like domain-containing protein, partial [Oscillospiraceae bacterium]|nr:transglutaminase-like domain-containing protein [Oscillospiraceae bacterium]
DYYSGEGWSASRQDGTLRFDSILWRGDRKDAFDLDKPVGTATAKALYKQLTEEISISVVHEKAALGALFTTGYVYGISLGKQLDGSNAYFNRRSDVFIKTYAPRKAEYTIRSLVWNTKVDGFDELFEQLEEQTSDKKRYAEVSERYTQLPENLPDKVRRTASDVTGGIISPYMKAKAISRWLAENNAYTLQPETPPEGVDFTAFFLESGKGYCVYYATAMAVLARCCGLPARYVQGFALTDSPWGGDYQYQATGLTAHAWSEVYFEGIGWVAFDPLSWDAGAPLGDNVGEGNLQMTMPPPAPPTPPPERPGGKPALAEPLDGLGGRAALALLIIGLFTPVLYGLYRWALWAGPRRITRVWELGAVRQHVAEPSKQLDAFYNDTLKLLALQELTVLPDETLGTFPKRIDRIVVLGDAKLADIAVAMMASHFGNIPPSDCDLERACLYHSLLESMTLETLGKRKYLIKRVLPWYFRRMQ